MSKLTSDDLSRILARNPALSVGDTGATPKLERPAWNEPLAAREGEKGAPIRVHLRIVSVRKRLLDPDNLSPKWLIDALRYCGALRGDEPDKLTLEVTQRKAEKGEEEKTIVEIFAI